MSEPRLSPKTPASKGWWYIWILCAVIVPGGTFALLASVFEGQEEILHLGWFFAALHIVSSVKLGRHRSAWLTVGLIFGGWVLMLVSLFVGCLAVVNH